MSANPGQSDSTGSRLHYWCLAIIGLAIALRLAAMVLFTSHSSEDIDAYRGIAEGIFEGRGYCSPNSDSPTAYRPPLYPLLLAASLPLGPAGMALLHTGLAALMLRWHWQSARQLGMDGSGLVLSLALLGLDPLLIWYGTYPMTEALCAALSAGMLAMLTSQSGSTHRTSLLTGMMFGLCVLARPTYWVWGALLLTGLISSLKRSPQLPANQQTLNQRHTLAVGLGVLLLVGPWALRNWLVLGHPVVMTTHGGYTLLLANNPSFYQHEVQQPWGTIWTGPEFDAWSADLTKQLDASGLTSEVEVDRHESRIAQKFIQENPLAFLQACGHRLAMFWNITPNGPVRDQIPASLLWLLGGVYLMWWLLALSGAVQVICRRAWKWWPVLSLILAYCAIHSVYWSNMRLRAPIMPAVALLAGTSISRRKSAESVEVAS